MSWPLTWENVDIPWYTMALQFDFQTYVHELFNTIQHLATIMMFIRKSKRNWPPTSVLNLIPIGLLSFRSLPWNSNLSHNTIRFFPFVLWYFMISPFPKEIWKNILTHVTWSFTDFHLSLLSSRVQCTLLNLTWNPKKGAWTIILLLDLAIFGIWCEKSGCTYKISFMIP